MSMLQPIFSQPKAPPCLSPCLLASQNQQFAGTKGVSAENRSLGFQPAFLDRRSGTVHLSMLADGRAAPMHLLDGLPAELVARRTDEGHVVALNSSVVAGFVRDGRFFTRREAAAAASTRPRGGGVKQVAAVERRQHDRFPVHPLGVAEGTMSRRDA